LTDFVTISEKYKSIFLSQDIVFIILFLRFQKIAVFHRIF